MRSVRDRAHDQDGAIAVMAAVLVSALVLAGALAVDVGRVAYVSRDLQGTTDRGALDSVQTLRAQDNEASTQTLAAVHEAALGTLERNPQTGTQRERLLYRVDLGEATDEHATDFTLVCGGYVDEDGPTTRDALVTAGILEEEDADDDSAATQEAPRACDAADIEGDHVDAVRLWTHGAVDYVLALGESSSTKLHKISSARAKLPPTCPEDDPRCEPTGALSAASTLASVEDGSANRLLEEYAGGSLSADLLGYRGAAAARVRLGDLIDVGPLNVGTMHDLLHTDIAVADLLEATVSVLEAGGDPASVAVAAEIEDVASREEVRNLADIQLGHDAETPEGERLGGLDVDTSANSGADVRVDAVDLLLTTLQLANLDNAVDLDLEVLGETFSVTATLVEGPVLRDGSPGQDDDGEWRTEARTAQVRVDLDVDLDQLTGLGGDLGDAIQEATGSLVDTLQLLGLSLTEDDLTLQETGVSVTAAEGVSRLLDVGCEDEGTQRVETTVRSARVAVDGDVFVIDRLLDDDLVSTNGEVTVTVGKSEAETTDFAGPWPDGPAIVPEGGAPLNGSLSSGDLVGDLDEDDLEGALPEVTDLLEVSLFGQHGLLHEVFDELGLGLTTVEVMGHDIDCTQVSLQPSVSDN